MVNNTGHTAIFQNCIICLWGVERFILCGFTV